MSRLAGIVVSGYSHHIMQRGNSRQETFFSNEDYEAYISLMAETIRKHEYTGRPLGSEKFVLRLEKKLNRMLLPKKAGQPKKKIRKEK